MMSKKHLSTSGILWSLSMAVLFSALSCYKNPEPKTVSAPSRQIDQPTAIQPTVVPPQPTVSELPTEPVIQPTPTQRVNNEVSATSEIPNSRSTPDENMDLRSESRKKKRQKLDEEPFAQIEDDNLNELSGIVVAEREGQYWGHNDQGNAPHIFRFDQQGTILQQVALKNVKNDDWEAITRDENHNLLIGAFGDNDENRTSYSIYQIVEPAPDARKSDSVNRIQFTYSDGQSHNCEAFFVRNQKIYLITKAKGKDRETTLFCLERVPGQSANIAQKVGVFDIKGVVTDAAYSPRNRYLAVLTYSGIGLYPIAEEKDLLAPPTQYVKIDFDQCEGICFDGDDLIVTNESGDIWKYSLQALLRK